MYDMVCTRPDLAYAISTVSRFKFRKATLRSSEIGAKISARDCKTRLGVSEIRMGKSRLLQGYIDANHARYLDQRRSTTGYVFTVTECVIS